MISGRFIQRGSILRNFLERFVVGRKRYQWFFAQLHLLAIAGLNYGEGSEVSQSGEHYVMDWVYRRNKSAENPVIFDVGGNIGNYSRAVLDRFNRCQIHAFEPSLNTFNLFCRNISSPLVKAHNFGFSDQDGKFLLYSNMEGSGLASVYQRTTTVAMPLQEEISLTTIDSFCSKEEIHRIHLLKIDVEGHELKVLQGARQMLANSAIDVIQFEFGGCNIDSRTYFHDFWKILHKNYDIYRVLKDGLQRITEYSLLNEIFVTVNFVAVKNMDEA